MQDLFISNWQAIPPATASWQLPWLLAPGSLTQRLQQVCQQVFKVEVLKHEFIPAPEFICEDLVIQPKQQVLQREVLLCDGEEPLVFAYSLLPEAALHGRYQELRELGSRPLGHWIFSEPVLKRQIMLFAELSSRARLFQNLNLPTETRLLGRKTLFVGADKPLLVSEFFLPALQAHSGEQCGA
ncbi:chorismate lyase [uncultured Thiothrix sp.]|uniref:chorismate--pyruvate lyase family protein n=1 Tax=uncultured Thiothrix sp. TaxID=223185 RepID=UPI0026108541|nr:chorismate lyase [uncultured Thiothrix sp.]